MKNILVLAVFMAFAGVVKAQTSTPVVDSRQQVQRARIRDGAQSGELTRRETANAVRDQRQIRRQERRAKADGTVTDRERARIHRDQNKASRKLRRNKNDDQSRPSANN